jgi:ABC-type multidrug transport system fused ATPase/permease subunit
MCCLLVDSALLCLWLWPRIKRKLRTRARQHQQESTVENQPLPAHEEYYTYEKEAELRSIFPNGALDNGLSVEFKDIAVPNPKTGGYILQGINCSAQKGSLLGIMGPSGSGKSKLLPTLQ